MSAHLARGRAYPKPTNWNLVPLHIRDGLARYIDHGIRPGSFLTAVLSNDLSETFFLADKTNRDRLFHIVRWLHDGVPSLCWGSPEKVRAWIDHRGFEVFKPITEISCIDPEADIDRPGQDEWRRA